MNRDQETIRRDIQIATLTGENLRLMGENAILRANVHAHEMDELRADAMKQREAFVAELATVRQAEVLMPPATPPSGAPLRVDAPLGPTEAPGT